MNVLVTGATGFVGTALAAKFQADGQKVVSVIRDWIKPAVGIIVRGDIRDQDFCRRVLADYTIDVVYHMAAQAIVSTCAEDPLTALDVAVMGTARLLQAVRDVDRSVRVIVSTSDKAYGSAPSPYTESTPLDARHAYEVSKACQDLVARMYHSNYGVDARVARAVNIYGPGDPNESRLIPQTALRLLRGEPPLLHAGASEMRRQYVYIEDLVEALRVVCDKGEPGHAYCVGSPDPPMSVFMVMQAMATAAGIPWVPPEVKARDAHFHEIQTQAVCDNKLRALGWSPRVHFVEGIERTIAAYRATTVKTRKLE